MAPPHKLTPNPLFAAAALATALTPQYASALDAYFEVGTAFEHFTNVFRTPEDEQSDTMQSLLANAAISHSSEELEANLGYGVERQSYQDDSFESENITEGGANIDWRILDDRISLLVDHSISDSVVNSNEPNTPDNRTQRSVLSAGPRFRLRPSQVDSIELTARRTDVNVDDIGESDSERDEASLLWNRRLPQQRNFNIVTRYADIEFPDREDENYKLTTAAIGFGSESAIGIFRAEVGASRAERDIQDDVSGESIDVSWASRADRSPIQWSISYVSAITDSSLGLSGGTSSLPSGGDGAGSDLTVIDIVKREELGLTLSAPVNAIHSTVIFTATEEREDYEESQTDDRVTELGLTLQHAISPRADVFIYTDRVRQDFLDADQELKDTEYGIGGSYRVIQSLALRWSAYRLKRDHSDENLSFTDNVYRLELTYGFGFGPNADNRGPESTSGTGAIRPERGDRSY